MPQLGVATLGLAVTTRVCDIASVSVVLNFETDRTGSRWQRTESPSSSACAVLDDSS